MWGCRTYGYDEPTPPDSFILQAVELRSLWQDKACVVAGLRRFGCMVCRWIAQDLSNLRSFLDQHDVRLVGVGPEALGLQEFLDGGYFSGGATLPGLGTLAGLPAKPCPPLSRPSRNILMCQHFNSPMCNLQPVHWLPRPSGKVPGTCPSRLSSADIQSHLAPLGLVGLNWTL